MQLIVFTHMNVCNRSVFIFFRGVQCMCQVCLGSGIQFRILSINHLRFLDCKCFHFFSDYLQIIFLIVFELFCKSLGTSVCQSQNTSKALFPASIIFALLALVFQICIERCSPASVAYGMSKAAIDNLTRSLWRELTSTNYCLYVHHSPVITSASLHSTCFICQLQI